MTRTKEVKFSISSKQRINLFVTRSSLVKRCNKSMVAPNNQDFAFNLSKIAVFLVLWRPMFLKVNLNLVAKLGKY